MSKPLATAVSRVCVCVCLCVCLCVRACVRACRGHVCVYDLLKTVFLKTECKRYTTHGSFTDAINVSRSLLLLIRSFLLIH